MQNSFVDVICRGYQQQNAHPNENDPLVQGRVGPEFSSQHVQRPAICGFNFSKKRGAKSKVLYLNASGPRRVVGDSGWSHGEFPRKFYPNFPCSFCMCQNFHQNEKPFSKNTSRCFSSKLIVVEFLYENQNHGLFHISLICFNFRYFWISISNFRVII